MDPSWTSAAPVKCRRGVSDSTHRGDLPTKTTRVFRLSTFCSGHESGFAFLGNSIALTCQNIHQPSTDCAKSENASSSSHHNLTLQRFGIHFFFKNIIPTLDTRNKSCIVGAFTNIPYTITDTQTRNNYL